MPLRFTQPIINHLRHANYEPSTIDAIARDMKIEADQRPAFDQAIQLLRDEKRILIGKDKLVRLPHFPEEVVGKLRLNPRGFGFVRTEQTYEDGDLFIPPGATADAISGDKVRARVSSSRSGRSTPGRRFQGEIIEVIERGQEHFVGTLYRERENWFVQPDGRMLSDPVIIRDPHAKNAKEGDKVVLELVHYPDRDYLAEGVITKVLGESGRPDVETQAVIVAHGLRTDFPEVVVREAREASRTFEGEAEGPWRNREDLTETFIFTIDPPDAKDFDDAISITHDEDAGEWTLGVHIADVSTFVTRGSELDKEAQIRGNSVYLPRLVLPMLPEVLSNGVCSLQEGVPRFTKSAFMTFDHRGKVLRHRVSATVINSAKRLTYIEAQALIDGNEDEARKNARTEPNYTDELKEALRMSDHLAKVLRKRRLRDGMIVLELPEVDLIFDEDGRVIDAVPEDNAFTHTIIEMFMVEANEAVARHFASLDTPLLRRIHPDPVHGDVEELQVFARAAHFSLPASPDRHDLQRLLDHTRGTPAARAVHLAVLRTLTKANYSPALIGHFALASDHYAHFTSPIRRYPDLAVHRVLTTYLELTDNAANKVSGRKRDSLIRKLNDDERVFSEEQLVTLGQHCSDTEVEAEDAERELREYLVLELLKEKHLGEEFPGVITGVIGSGIFISIEKYLVEGMVRTEDIPGARSWRINEDTGRLHAKGSGLTIGIGDNVRVQIVAVDLAARKLDLRLLSLPEPSPEPERGPHSSRERKQGSRTDRSQSGRGPTKKKSAKRGAGKRR